MRIHGGVSRVNHPQQGFYMAEVGGGVFRGCEWFYVSVCD